MSLIENPLKRSEFLNTPEHATLHDDMFGIHLTLSICVASAVARMASSTCS